MASETLTEDPALSQGTPAQLQLQGHSLAHLELRLRELKGVRH